MFQKDVLLKNYSNYKIGGPARYFSEPKDIDEMIAVFGKAQKLKTPVFVLGGGTNVLFSDDGFQGLILRPNLRFIEKKDNRLRVGAGILMDELINYVIEKKLSGLEWAGGLPGSLGGAIFGNAGAFGGEMKDLVKEVLVLDISGKNPAVKKRALADCDFGYRSSFFKKNKNKEIILEAVLELKKGDKEKIKSAVEEKINYRKKYHPLEHPNIGSIFKNVDLVKVTISQKNAFASVIKTDPFPMVPVAHLISEAGLKGISFGGAIISPKHPNFIVNSLNAAASDVKKLIELAKNKVYDKFKIELREEIEYV